MLNCNHAISPLLTAHERGHNAPPPLHPRPWRGGEAIDLLGFMVHAIFASREHITEAFWSMT